jgi:hypothetical protein
VARLVRPRQRGVRLPLRRLLSVDAGVADDPSIPGERTAGVGRLRPPGGVPQPETAFAASYDAARSLAFSERDLARPPFWARMPGDTLLVAGTFVFAYDVLAELRSRREVTAPEDL